MNKTPEKISRERQKIGREMETWREGAGRARADRQMGNITPEQCEKQLLFCEEQMKECRKRMAALRGKGKKTWTFRKR